jgi:hypothetical protein
MALVCRGVALGASTTPTCVRLTSFAVPSLPLQNTTKPVPLGTGFCEALTHRATRQSVGADSESASR